MPHNKPKLDKNETFVELEKLGIQNCTYRRYDNSEELPLVLPGSYPEPETIIIAPSGYYAAAINNKSPEPSGNIYLCKCYRNDSKDKHINVDNWLFWQDCKERCWQLHFIDSDEHIQEYLLGTELGNIAGYKGYPAQKEGSLKEYEADGKLGHDKSIPPYE